MVNTIPIPKPGLNLGALAKRVHLNKEYSILEKDGIPIIGIMDAGELEDYLELQDPKMKRDIAKVLKNSVPAKAGPPGTSWRSCRERRKQSQNAAPRYDTSFIVQASPHFEQLLLRTTEFVLLLNKAVVIFAVRSGAGEGDSEGSLFR